MTIQNQFYAVKTASKVLIGQQGQVVDGILLQLADEAVAATQQLLAENAKDLALMSPDDPKYDRLELTEERIAGIAQEIRNVAGLSNPVGELLQERDMPNGMNISKVRVPLGVVGVIYEARPNVTFDVFSLCFKTGNAVLLKGGSDAHYSNTAIVGIIQKVLKNNNINPDVVTLLPPDREATEQLLQATEVVDVIIPRGSQRLINYVRAHSRVPVIETGAGIVHTYADESATIEKVSAIVFNAKTRRPSVCNSLDCLVLHRSLLPQLAQILSPLATKDVVLFADLDAFEALKGKYPSQNLQVANNEHFGTEFLSLKLAIKTVGSLEEALQHIDFYSSKHSEAIISENAENIARFLNCVDAAAVYSNVSTAFTDGAQFGLGAEIGISTQKLHARGPMGLSELTSYKWIVKGNGQVRN